jgi:hypothetical protein
VNHIENGTPITIKGSKPELLYKYIMMLHDRAKLIILSNLPDMITFKIVFVI